LDDCSAQVFPYNIFAYCSICRVDCKFARNKKKYIFTTEALLSAPRQAIAPNPYTNWLNIQIANKMGVQQKKICVPTV
jgi:hypothetical protein